VFRNLNQHEHPNPFFLPAPISLYLFWRFKGIVRQVLAARNLKEAFGKEVAEHLTKVKACDLNRIMIEKRIRQVVIRRENGRVALLTQRGWMLWLQKTLPEISAIDFDSKEVLAAMVRRYFEVTVGEVLELEMEHEGREHWTVMGAQQTVDEALRVFERDYRSDSPRLKAVIITDTGKSDGKVVGIITALDLARESFLRPRIYRRVSIEFVPAEVDEAA